ncbi:MAG: hypothetical protein WBG37_03955 [Desulfobacterales bacterium]
MANRQPNQTAGATLVLANHRPETIPPAAMLMARHDALILEEPPEEGFREMLAGRLEIESYLADLDLEYPEFSRCMSQTLRTLHQAGTALYQVEPFIQRLIEIHERFATGANPDQIRENPQLAAVYEAERRATATLLDFYEASTRGGFGATLSAVKQFARQDARRFVLRDQMRAAAIAALLENPGTFYIEAGLMHFTLWRELKQRLPRGYPLKLHFLMAPIVREIGGQRHLYGPGDLLTLRYMFHPDRELPENDLLAARALVYNKLIIKEELSAPAGTYPHTRDELAVSGQVRSLSMADCRELLLRMGKASSARARETVRDYLRYGVDEHSDAERSP